MIDFKELGQALLNDSGHLLTEWLPGGKLLGKEWTCGDLLGGEGKSCKINIESGAWQDFQTGEKGGDLISLYAAIKKVTQIEAAKELSEKYNIAESKQITPVKPQPKPTTEIPSKPPKGAGLPHFKHYKLGSPSFKWEYKDKASDLLFFITRYESQDGKQIIPWSYVDGKWVNKHWSSPRPLYRLDKLRPGKPVLIVEGEKAADAAVKLLGEDYDVVTWVGGANAWQNADWTPIYGKSILIWPDSDDPGRECGEKIGDSLTKHCKQIKMILADRSKGWDAADALAGGWDRDMVIKWAKPRVRVITEPKPIKKETPTIRVEDNTIPLISESVAALHEKVGIPKTASGQPICNVQTCRMMLESIREFKDMFWFDEFHQKYYTRMPKPTATGIDDSVREFSTIDNLFLLDFFQSKLGLSRLGDEMLNKAVMMHSQKNLRNEPKDWFETLEWDGKKRIDEFFIDCFGGKPGEYTRAVGRNFWTSMVARIYRPGCQNDYMVVLEGAQGIGKSTALQAIGGKWYTTASNAIERSDFYQVLQGNILIEIAELDAFSKAEVTRIKSVITDSTDRYRAPYDRKPQDYPRQSVFVGTTNESHWQRDHTGGRRFWPIYCQDINLQKIKDDREQLFAEAIVRFKKGADWYMTPFDETKAEQERRRQVDEWEDRIEAYLTRPGGADWTTIMDIAESALKIEAGKVDVRVQRRIAAALSSLGWEKVLARLDNKRKRVWKPIVHKMYEGCGSDFFLEKL